MFQALILLEFLFVFVIGFGFVCLFVCLIFWGGCCKWGIVLSVTADL